MSGRPKSDRPQFVQRTFRLTRSTIREHAAAAILELPIDDLRPLQVVIREEPKRRKLDQQALMWAGPLADIAAQAWVEGRQYSAEVWHSYFKAQFLPEQFDPELCLDDYRKWDVDPAGERVLIGSTTQLTVRGMSDYLEQVYAFGASLGVHFTAQEGA